MNLATFTSQVQANCNRADARYAQNFGLCSYLLQMREYYRWVHQIPFDQSLLAKSVTPWVLAQEEAWEAIETEDYQPVTLAGLSFDPFDEVGINHHLQPLGLVYSGGRAPSGRPLFFVGERLSETKIQGKQIITSGTEHARGMLAPAAYSRQGQIFIRQEALRSWLWAKVEEWRSQKKPGPAHKAIALFDFATTPLLALEELTTRVTPNLVWHELGEGQLDELWGTPWQEMILALLTTKAEYIARALRDLTADALVTLPQLVAQGDEFALHFYFANFTGLRRELAPQLRAAYDHWQAQGDLSMLLQECQTCAQQWQEVALIWLSEFAQQGAQVQGLIQDYWRPN